MIKKLFIISTLLITLHMPVSGQEKRFEIFDYSDGIYWAGSSADIASSVGKRELNPLFRNSEHRFSPAKALIGKAALWSAFKAVEWQYADRRRSIRIVKIIAGGVFGAIAVRGLFVAKARR